jgi:RNA polymerase sigma-70 factor (ECF subfamily)
MRGNMDFEGLVARHYAALYRFALSLCGRESEACDLVQETFYLLATKGHQLEDASKAKSWLFTTLYRQFIGSRRRFARFPHQELSEVEDELPPAPELPGRADWAVLSVCLARMDEAFRAPVALFYLEDYSYQEIAGILEVPLGTVKSRIARGIAALQRMMTDPESARPRTTRE